MLLRSKIVRYQLLKAHKGTGIGIARLRFFANNQIAKHEGDFTATKGNNSIILETNKSHLSPIFRYLPPRDPNMLLIETDKLSSREQRWQWIFAITPWVLFGCMAMAPYLFIKNSVNRVIRPDPDLHGSSVDEAFGNAMQQQQYPLHEDVSYSTLPVLVARPSLTLVVLYADTYASHVYVPVLLRLVQKARSLGLQISLATIHLDTLPKITSTNGDLKVQASKNVAAESMMQAFPVSNAPHVMLIKGADESVHIYKDKAFRFNDIARWIVEASIPNEDHSKFTELLKFSRKFFDDVLTKERDAKVFQILFIEYTPESCVNIKSLLLQ